MTMSLKCLGPELHRVEMSIELRGAQLKKGLIKVHGISPDFPYLKCKKRQASSIIVFAHFHVQRNSDPKNTKFRIVIPVS